MLDRFEQQYGVDLRKSVDGKPILPFTKFTIRVEGRPGLEDFMKGFSQGTLLGRGIHDMLGAFIPVAATEGFKVESLTYCYRPYIDINFRRTEAVWLDFHFIDPSGKVVDSENLYIDEPPPAPTPRSS